LQNLGYKIVTEGTENHLLLLDLRPLGLTGSKAEKILDAIQISVNKNTVHGDKSAVTPGGIRLGTAALTSRGFQPDDIRQVAHLIHESLQLALSIQNSCGKLLKDFVVALSSHPGVKDLQGRVHMFAGQFSVPCRKQFL
jgi:glycine hydroxymethyltransferase